MIRKTISVAMTTYNGERYLREQLDSIYNQTLQPDEVIVCDDNSQDGTLAILEEYCQKKGLQYYKNTPALGVNENFYKAISLCSGDYISLSDQDDIWLPTKIEESYKKLYEIDDGGLCAVSCMHNDIDASGRMLYKMQERASTIGYAATLLGSFYVSQGCTLMFNQKLAKYVLKHKGDSLKFNEIWYDFMLGSLCAIQGKKVNLGIPLILYRHHSNNVLGKERKKGRGLKAWVERHKEATFSGFIADERVTFLSTINQYLDDDIKSEQVRALLAKIDMIANSKSYIKKLATIYTIKEYPLTKRVCIIIKSIIMKGLRTLYKH